MSYNATMRELVRRSGDAMEERDARVYHGKEMRALNRKTA
jgi:hypothetical protein